MIRSLSLQNFKAHRSTEIELGRLTVLVGPNGAGKTSVLEALQIMSRLVMTAPETLLQGELEPATLLHRGSGGPIRVETQSEVPGLKWGARMELSVGEQVVHEKRPWNVKLQLDTPGTTKTSSIHTAKQRTFLDLGNEPLWRELNSAVLFRLDPRKIAAPGYSDNLTPRVEPDGANVAAALAALKLSDDERFDAVVKGLQRVVPSVKRIRLRPARVMITTGDRSGPGEFKVRNVEVTGHRIAFDFNRADDLPASAASEGTLVTLALLTVLHAPTRPKLLLIDDIEQSLHPLAQIELMRQLSELLEQFSDLQIVATTHSPYVLDGVDPTQVLVFYPRESGDIVIKRLSEHPDAERSKGTLSAGQIWSLDPEEWVAEEKAAS